MCLFSSNDDGKTFSSLDPVWSTSKGQWLQGGASNLLELKSGRLLLPLHGGGGNQWRQKNSAWCCTSDDQGKTWQRSALIDLPERGAMEASVAELADGSLLMSLPLSSVAPICLDPRTAARRGRKRSSAVWREANHVHACEGSLGRRTSYSSGITARMIRDITISAKELH